jgi:hypothetical protein
MKRSLGILAPALAVVALAGSTSGKDDPCAKCKPAKAEWTWKSNGYAIGPTKEDARALSEKSATDKACATSATYLDAQKLKCKGNCNAGTQVDECAPDKTPACDTGTYDDNAGQWTFVCRKQNEDRSDKVSCDKEEAKKNPGYTMCDVSVKAVRTLPCTHPDCAE